MKRGGAVEKKRGPRVLVVTKDASGKTIKVELRKTRDLEYVRYPWQKRGEWA